MDDLSLVAAFRRYEYNDALFDEKPHDGLAFRIATYEGALLTAMRAMLRERAYDVCEMSPSSFLIAKLAGAPLIGLPIFPFCQYPLGQIVVRDDSPLTSVEDIGRTTIAVRTWAQPTALWARSWLMDYLGIDLGRVTWMFVGDDPVAGIRRPEGAVQKRGESLESLLLSGAADVAIGMHDVPAGCRRLVEDPVAAAAKWTADTDVVPANHLVVVDAKHAGSDVPDRVCERFDAVVRSHMAKGDLSKGVIGDLRKVNPSRWPLPSGRNANAKMWETLVGAMVTQGMMAPVNDPLSLLHAWEPSAR